MKDQASQIADAYKKEIYRLVSTGHLDKALEKLHDFAENFHSSHLYDYTILSSRYHLVQREARKGNHPTKDLVEIADQILSLCDYINRDALVNTSPPKIEPTASEASNPKRIAFDQLRRQYHQQRNSNSSDSSTLLINAEGISFSFGTFSLDSISFTIQRAEILGVVGRNGSGKTTLLHILVGALAPQTGRISYPALNTNADGWLAVRSQIAYVSQDQRHWSGTVAQCLHHTASTFGTRGARNEAEVSRLLERFGLADRRHSTWRELSAGYQTRVALLRALLSKPKLIVFDEPLAFLDIVASARFVEDLRAIAKNIANPIAIVLTSQNLYEVEALADKLIVLDEGSIRFNGTIDALATLNHARIILISTKAENESVARAISGFPVLKLLETSDGYALFIDKTIEFSKVGSKLFEALGTQITALRDVTSSSWSLLTTNEADGSNHAN